MPDIATLKPESENPISTLIISNTKDAQRLALVEELTFTLIPLNPSKTLNLYNDKYNTGLPYSTSVPRTSVIDALKTFQFTFGEGFLFLNTIIYVIEADSIKEKRQKKTAPSFFF